MGLQSRLFCYNYILQGFHIDSDLIEFRISSTVIFHLVSKLYSPFLHGLFHVEYNGIMSLRRIRLILALVVLAASLVLLVWGFWPLIRESQVLHIPSSELQLPTRTGFLFTRLTI